MDEQRQIVGQIEAVVKEPGFIYALTFILMRDTFFAPEEVADISWSEHLNIQELTFLVGLFFKHELSLDIPMESDPERQVAQIDSLFSALHRTHTGGLMENLLEREAGSRTGESAEETYRRIFGGAAMTEPIFYSGSGAYDFQYLEFAANKYREDSDWITSHTGIDVPIMALIARELKKLSERKFMSRLDRKGSTFADICQMALSILCFERDDLSQFGEENVTTFIRMFSFAPGLANQKLELPGQYNQLHSHPIVRLPSGNYFLPIGFNLRESIYESPFYWMNSDKAYREQALRHRGDFAEEMTAQLLKSVFGEANVHARVEARKNKKEVVTDIDVLAVAGNKAVVAQVKSKRLTELAKSGNEEKLVSDFKLAVQDAYDQAVRSRNAILGRANKLYVGGTELNLSEAIDDVYILCVTLDHYPAVTHQVDVYLEKKADDPFPIALSIFDLDLIAFYLNDPFAFLYYLRQRVALSSYFKADSEITLLGFHLRHKLFRAGDGDRKFLDGSFAQLIDANFPVLRGGVAKTPAADKLFPKWQNKEFRRLIEQIKSTGEPGFTDALFFLYDLASHDADNLMRMIKGAKMTTASDRRNHDFTFVFPKDRCGITVVSTFSSLDSLKTNLMGLALLRKYISKADMWLGLGLIATSPNLVDAIIFDKTQWTEDPVLEALVDKRFAGGSKMRYPSGTKIGRNDRCPCGSGRKFKRCHGA